MLCLLLAGALPAPAQNPGGGSPGGSGGNWQIGVSYSGSGLLTQNNTNYSGAATSINNLAYQPANTTVYLQGPPTTVTNNPTSTLSGGITASLTANNSFQYAWDFSSDDEFAQSSPCSMTVTLTWQPGPTNIPAPGYLWVRWRRHASITLGSGGATSSGIGLNVTGSAELDTLSTPTYNLSQNGPCGSETVAPSSTDDPGFTWEKLTTSNGTATRTFNVGWSLKVVATGPNDSAQYFTSVQSVATMSLDFCLPNYDVGRFGGRLRPVGGSNRTASSDPSFTRWLPLSFSPSVDNQPFRHQAGALPGPWGNTACYYSPSIQSETNLDLPGAILDYVPGPGSDGTYNSPSGPYSVILAGFTPAYSITDANGDRLVFDSSLNPYSDVHSSLVKLADQSFQLQSAGPPGHMKERGFYTYAFQPLNGGIGRLTSIADNLGNTQTLTWGGFPYLMVTDSSSGRQLLFYATSGYISSVDAPGPNNSVNTHTVVSFDSVGHMTAVNVYAGGSSTLLHSDTWAYGGPNGDSITSHSQGMSQASFADTGDSFVLDPFGVSTARLSSASYGSATDNSSSDDGQSILGTWNYTYGATSQGYDNWSPASQTNTVQDARGNTSSVFIGMTQDITPKISSFRSTGPDFSGAPTNSNITTTTYNPDITNPTSVTTIDPLGHNRSSTLNAYGETTSVTDPLNHSWSFNYSGTDARLLSSTVDPTSLTWHFNYGENGNPASTLTSIVDSANVTRQTISYNSFGQAVSETVPAAVSASGLAETTGYSYNPTTGDLTAITDPLGNQATIDSYDPLGDPLSSTVYPDTGNPASSAYPLRTSVTYDASQMPTQITGPNGTSLQPVYNNGITTGYNLVNQGVTQASLSLSIDTRGRMYSGSDGVGKLQDRRYDKSSNLTRVIDGAGHTTTLTYGKSNEVTGLTWPDGTNRTSLAYDAAGRTTTATDERGITQSFLYDNANRLTDVQFPSYSTQNVHFTYDSANRPLSATDSSGSTSYSYDSTLKRLQSAATVLSALPAGNNQFTRSFAYYPDGKRKTLTLTVGANSYTWTYYWDAAGRLSSLSSPFSETTGWSFDHAGRITGQSTTTAAAAQLASLYTYGVSGQAGDPSTAPAYLRTIQQTINGGLFWNYTLQHSYLNQLLSQTGAGSDGTTESASYSYDLRGRLASDLEQYTGGGHSFSNSGSFGYDLANNLEGQAGGWTYNADDQVSTANSGLGGLPAATGLSYDAAGNLTGLNGMTLSYDPWGHLSSVSGTPSGTVSFTYDSAGRRVSKTAGGATTYYLYDGDTLLAEVNSASQVQTIYTWGAQGLISDRVNLQGTPQSRFYEFDATGSTRALLDQNGVGLSRGTYSAWGSSTGYSPGTPLAWNGRAGIYTDAETGLVLMGGRYYSPSLGRFISRDEIGFDGGPNPYSYCAGDPIDFMDPSGQNAVGDWYWGGMGGLSQAVDNSFPFNGSTAAFGDAAGRNDSGKADGWAVAAAAGNWGLRLGMAGLAAGRGLTLAAAIPRLAAAAMPTLAAAHPDRLPEALPEAEVPTGESAGEAVPDLITVCRWGRPGLQPGDWVMKGQASRLNYVLTGKWQRGFGNEYAPFDTGEEFRVLRSTVTWPSGIGIDGRWKGVFGQRIYKP